VVKYPCAVGELTESLCPGGHLADRGLAMALLTSLSLHQPMLPEGEVGVGKTKVAKVLAGIFGRKLIRLQCYEASTPRPTVHRCSTREGQRADRLPLMNAPDRLGDPCCKDLASDVGNHARFRAQ